MDAAVLIPDYHFYSTEAFFRGGGIDFCLSIEHLCSGKAAVLHLLALRRPGNMKRQTSEYSCLRQIKPDNEEGNPETGVTPTSLRSGL